MGCLYARVVQAAGDGIHSGQFAGLCRLAPVCCWDGSWCGNIGWHCLDTPALGYRDINHLPEAQTARAQLWISLYDRVLRYAEILAHAVESHAFLHGVAVHGSTLYGIYRATRYNTVNSRILCHHRLQCQPNKTKYEKLSYLHNLFV